MSEFGVESCYNTVNTEYNSVCKLDATHVVVAYKDTGGSGYGCAKVGVINGNTVTWGVENVFNSAVTNNISVGTLDSTHFVVGYADLGNSSHGTAIVGLTDGGTTISSYGSENVFNSAATSDVGVSVLDSTHFAIGYKDDGNSSKGTAIVGLTDGGTTISSYGSENVFSTIHIFHGSIGTLDSTHFVVVYQDPNNSSYGTARVGVISGTTISSYGTENVFNSASTLYTSVVGLDSTHFAIGYRDGGNSNYGTAIVGLTDGGTTISSYGSENVFNSAITNYISISSLDSTHFVVVYQDDGGDDYGCVRQGTLSGTTISGYDTEQVFNSAITKHVAGTTLNSTDFIVVYKDDGGADYGCGRVWGTVLGWSGTVMGVSSPAKVMGIAVANVTKVIGIS